jgi:hypothetical protein
MITRKQWDSLEVGDVLLLQGYAAGLARFEVAHVDSYTGLAQWTDSGILVSPGKSTVIEVTNSKHESLRFNSYLCDNPLSRIVKKEKDTDA